MYNFGECHGHIALDGINYSNSKKLHENGPDIDSILDRLPTAHVLDEENGEYIVAAEVFGTGINMWIRSQGDYIEMIEEV